MNRTAMKNKWFGKINNNLINGENFLKFSKIIENLAGIIISIFLLCTTLEVNDSIVKFNKTSASTNEKLLEINERQNDFIDKQTNLSLYEFYEKRVNNIKDILDDMQMSFLETKNVFLFLMLFPPERLFEITRNNFYWNRKFKLKVSYDNNIKNIFGEALYKKFNDCIFYFHESTKIYNGLFITKNSDLYKYVLKNKQILDTYFDDFNKCKESINNDLDETLMTYINKIKEKYAGL